jgi:hypothetical protein
MEIAPKSGHLEKWRSASELRERILEPRETEQQEAATRLGAGAGVQAELQGLLDSSRRGTVLDQELQGLLSTLPEDPVRVVEARGQLAAIEGQLEKGN